MKFLVVCDICETGAVEPHYMNQFNLCDACKMDEAVQESVEAFIDAMEGFYE